MSQGKENEERLHQGLRTFYNQNAAYFAGSRAANLELTPERALVFGWINSGERVLDVGCGSCENALHLGGRVAYFGCDISFIALEMAASALPDAGRRLVQGESQTLPFSDGAFDAVMSTYALEHFVYPRESLEEMWRVCRPGGRVILLSPAYDHPLLLPPSVSHWPAARRAKLVLSQAWRQLMRHLRPRRFYFAQVTQPRVLSGAFSSDFDAVHLVSAREIGNFFHAKGARFLFERKRTRRPVAGGAGGAPQRLRERGRNVLLSAGLGEYAGLSLQLVAGKP